MKHSTTPSSAHKKLASKLKAINPSPSGEPPMMPVESTTTTAQSSTSSSTTLASASSVPQASMAATFTVPRFSTTRMVLDPTADVLDDPNPDQRSQDSRGSRRRRPLLQVRCPTLLP
ncbi:hypothetical protein FKP32DRAFT_1670790 [Trametes sanguinea]|nr:hypothetical protein FKP32DRAFT_1670790 [Trametes sanguinea]